MTPGTHAAGYLSAVPTLLGISYSPWSQKARWALDHAGVQYRYREFTPVLSELPSRVRYGIWSGRVSVPFLSTDDGVLRDSWDIACWANRQNPDAALIPEQSRHAIQEWHQLSEDGTADARERVVRRTLESRDAQIESQVGYPMFVRPLLTPLVRAITKKIATKYADTYRQGALRDACLRVRSALADSGGEYLLGSFTYADMAIATMLDGVEPCEDRFVKRSPAIRECWRDQQLSVEFEDLLRWRRGLYEKHRPPRNKRS